MDAAFQVIVMILLFAGLVSVVVYVVRHDSGPTSRSADRAADEARAWGRHSGGY